MSGPRDSGVSDKCISDPGGSAICEQYMEAMAEELKQVNIEVAVQLTLIERGEKANIDRGNCRGEAEFIMPTTKHRFELRRREIGAQACFVMH